MSTKYSPKATQGPIPKANNKVPTPTVPPKYQPILTTEISKDALTAAIGRFVTYCKPIISPSRGPAPKLETKYMPPPIPTVITDITAKIN